MDITQTIIEACQEDNIELIYELLKSNNLQDDDIYIIIEWIMELASVAPKYFYILEDLVNKYRIDFSTDKCMILASNKSLDIVKFVVKQGADIDDYALLIACAHDLEIVEYLVQNGANLLNPDALIQAVNYNKLDIVKYLIQNGAKDYENQALYLAFDLQHTKIYKYLKNINFIEHTEEEVIEKEIEKEIKVAEMTLPYLQHKRTPVTVNEFLLKK